MPANLACTLVWAVPTKTGAVLIGDYVRRQLRL